LKPVSFDPEAEEEIREAGRYYRAEREELAAKFILAVDDALQRLRESPQAQGPHPYAPSGLDVRRARVKGFRYWLVFLERENDVLVLACAHVRRRPGYWHGRLSP
jgi:plasmid stabilization system protein ParE